jgi:hypothetical protein
MDAAFWTVVFGVAVTTFRRRITDRTGRSNMAVSLSVDEVSGDRRPGSAKRVH